MKDKHTVGEKMARNSRKIAILLFLFVSNKTICVLLGVYQDHAHLTIAEQFSTLLAIFIKCLENSSLLTKGH